MHRRRDHLGRFLPNLIHEDPFNIEYPNPKVEEREEEEELFENMFADQFQSSSTSEESLHLMKFFLILTIKIIH